MPTLNDGPHGLAYDSSTDTLYVAVDRTIRTYQISNGAAVSSARLAGTPATSGSRDGPPDTALFAYPQGLQLDGQGHLYVADFDNATVRRIDLSTDPKMVMVSTLAGVTGRFGAEPGPLPAQLNRVQGLALVPSLGLVAALPTENALVVISAP
jgi:DNA-binding beta-propeller fold protein YncE